VQQEASGPAGDNGRSARTLPRPHLRRRLRRLAAIASILQSFGRGEGIYGYETIELTQFNPRKFRENPIPQTHAETVHQYGADYFNISTPDPVTVVFTGTQQVPLVDACAAQRRIFLRQPARRRVRPEPHPRLRPVRVGPGYAGVLDLVRH
jgi:hypothetical protein